MVAVGLLVIATAGDREPYWVCAMSGAGPGADCTT